jgi:hypothetical protein
MSSPQWHLRRWTGIHRCCCDAWNSYGSTRLYPSTALVKKSQRAVIKAGLARLQRADDHR